MPGVSEAICNERKDRYEEDKKAIWGRISTLDRRMWVALYTALGAAVGAMCTLLTVIIMLLMGKL